MTKLIHFISLYMNNIRFKKKMLVIYLIAGILPIALFCTVVLYRMTRTMVESEIRQLRLENNRSKDTVFRLGFLVNTIMSGLYLDEDLQTLLSSSYQTDEEGKNAIRSFRSVRNCVNNYPEIASITIYHENHSLSSYLEFKEITPDIRSQGWYQTAINSYSQNIWFYDDSIESGSYLHMMKYISLPENPHIIIIFNISNNALNSSLKTGKFTTLLGLNQETVIYSSSALETGMDYPWKVSERSGTAAVTHEKYHNSKVMFLNTNLTAVNSNDRFQITTINNCYPYIARIIFFFLLIMAVTLLFPLLLIVFFTNVMNTRINTIRNQMHRIASNNLSLSGIVEGNDEFGELYQDIKSTMLSIQKLNAEFYENRLRQKELESEQNKILFTALANQINPHFLFNSLESIRMQAAINGQRELVEIIGSLGKLLRYSLDNRNKTVTLSHELTYLHAYFEIQHFRFSQVAYQIVIDPGLDVEGTWLLPLMIQPLVENIFSHSQITLVQNGLILITIIKRSEQLFISIQDNGIGISEQKLAEINEYLAHPDESQSNSIGIRNVHKRIRLFYGAQYGLSVTCPEGRGTTVTICIPVRKEFSSESAVY